MNQGHQPGSEQDMALDLGGLLLELRRAVHWLLPLVLIVTGLVFVSLLFIAPKYRGEARLLIESTDDRFPGSARGVEGERALLDSEGVASQVQLLMSGDLVRRVVERLDLSVHPEFHANAGPSALGGLLSAVGLSSRPTGNTVAEKVRQYFYENLDVYRLEGSRVIAIDYASEDPQLAALVANAIVDEYIELQSRAKRKTTEQTSAALEPQIEELRVEVEAARKAVADFRSGADLLFGADNMTLNQQQLGEISSEYSAAQAAKAEAQAKAELIRGILTAGGSLETASDVLSSQLIQRLRERQVAIQSNIAELSITLLPNHPQLKALRSQLNDYDEQIRTEARKILNGLENDAKVASQQAAALKDRLEELKVSAAKSNSDQVALSELEREANAKAAQLDNLIASFREADSRLRAQVLPADARIISRAAVPIEPFSPKIIATTIIAALATAILGTAFVVMRAFLSGNALQSIGGAHAPRPASAQAPAPASFGWNGSMTSQNPDYGTWASYGAGYGTSYGSGRFETAANEGVRDEPAAGAGGRSDMTFSAPQMDTAMRRPGQGGPGMGPAADPGRRPANRPPEAAYEAPPEDFGSGRIVVLGIENHMYSHKLAFNIVRRAAEAGQSAIVLEAFPQQADSKAAAGFSDIVNGKAAFGDVVYRDAVSSAHIIEAGRMAISDELAHSERFSAVLDALSATYETIVIDLGAIDGSTVSARILAFGERVLIAASSTDNSFELSSAANLLARNTGAEVELVLSGDGERFSRGGSDHAA